jgi:hypothetical protein
MNESSTAASIDFRPVRGGIVLTPSRVNAMIRTRSAYQVVKFRTTCTDCVPNL